MAFTTLDPNGLLPGEPWTSAKALAVYENPIEIAGQTSGAPKIADRVILPTQGSATLTFNDLGDYAGIFIRFSATGGPTFSAGLQYSTNNGSTWATEQAVFLAIETGAYTELFFDFDSGAYRGFCTSNNANAVQVSGTYSGASLSINAVRITTNASGNTIAGIGQPQGGLAP